MYDALQLSEKIKSLVTRKIGGEIQRKYYRFRPAGFYGGIASADCVGCNLRCVYCWSNDLAREGKIGDFFSSREVVSRLLNIAEKFGFELMRITGNEPTISKEHLISVLEKIPPNFTFILETNGILLDEGFVEKLEKFDNLHVRVSIKGCDEGEFSKITGAQPSGFELQLKALENCVEHDIPCNPAILIDVVDKSKITILKRRLEEIDKTLVKNIEFETLIPYPHVLKRLKYFDRRVG
ncbi:MAG: radical SAM protein [Candidatus Aenigmatarchaeota archaeon]